MKSCSKCNKTVYPLEELKCLDRIWHKVCFKCEVCGMTLNMKNYKGYEKKPYCPAHYPTTKYTVVADTPENRRIAENTKIQSQVKYHAEFEKDKGRKISVHTDPELERLKQSSKNISNIEYHNVMERKEKMEKLRTDEDDFDEEPVRAVPRGSGGGAVFQSTTVTVGSNGASHEFVPPSSNRQSASGGVKQPGSIFDYNPMAHEVEAPDQRHSAAGSTGSDRPTSTVGSVVGPVYRAMYDYDAGDDDEVSFVEGDLIINSQFIDEGWMSGTVQRNGETGLLPANYVERCT